MTNANDAQEHPETIIENLRSRVKELEEQVSSLKKDEVEIQQFKIKFNELIDKSINNNASLGDLLDLLIDCIHDERHNYDRQKAQRLRSTVVGSQTTENIREATGYATIDRADSRSYRGSRNGRGQGRGRI